MVEPAKEKQSSILLIFIFPLLCGALKGFMKAFKGFYENLLRYHKEVRKQKFKLIFVLIELRDAPGRKG